MQLGNSRVRGSVLEWNNAPFPWLIRLQMAWRLLPSNCQRGRLLIAVFLIWKIGYPARIIEEYQLESCMCWSRCSVRMLQFAELVSIQQLVVYAVGRVLLLPACMVKEIIILSLSSLAVRIGVHADGWAGFTNIITICYDVE